MSLKVVLPSGQGSVQGYSDTSPLSSRSILSPGPLAPVSKWLGVPYAAAGRWERPGPPALWEGIRPATEFGPAPWQATEDLFALKGRAGSVERGFAGLSEDSLTANIFAPGEAKGPVPVLVWLHGGGFTNGRADAFLYDATQLVRDAAAGGDPVVVVTFNYRVGAFGWLAHPDLSEVDAEGLSGNYGLYDQLAAIRWIKANIAAFGGDANKITLFGESAGGISAALLAGRRRQADEGLLFRGVIAQSGVAHTRPSRPTKDGYSEYSKLLEAFSIGGGSAAQRVERLRAISAEELDAWTRAHPPADGWMPTIEESEAGLWNRPPGAAFTSGDYDPHVEAFILGWNADEGTLQARGSQANTATGLSQLIEKTFGRFPALAKEAALLYPHVEGETQLRLQSGTQWIGDQQRGGAAFYLANLLTTIPSTSTSTKPAVYLYRFDPVLPEFLGLPELGSHHVLDVPFVFRHRGFWEEGDAAERTSASLLKLWAQFAHGVQWRSSEWPRYAPDTPRRIRFHEDGGVEVEDGWVDRRLEFWSRALGVLDAAA